MGTVLVLIVNSLLWKSFPSLYFHQVTYILLFLLLYAPKIDSFFNYHISRDAQRATNVMIRIYVAYTYVHTFA